MHHYGITLLHATSRIIADSRGIIADSQGIIADSQEIIVDSQGIIADSQGIIADSHGIIADPQGIISESHGIITESHEIIAYSHGIIADSYGIIADSQDKVFRTELTKAIVLLDYLSAITSQVCTAAIFVTEDSRMISDTQFGGGVYLSSSYSVCHVKWVPVTTAWRVLGLRMEERPPGMEGSCEYIE
jgi:hypothetical protein